jgi:hypothetical protein
MHRYEYMFLTINYKNSINWIRVKESGFEPQALIAVHQYALLKIELNYQLAYQKASLLLNYQPAYQKALLLFNY